MAIINTLPAFRDYIKKMLGGNVVNIEVDDDHIDQIIEDSVQDFQRYTYGEGTYRDALAITLSAGVSAYYLGPSVESVLDISLSQSGHGINDLFTPQHQILYNDFINGNFIGTYSGVNGSAGLGGAMVMGNYDIAMIYLKEIEDHFVRKYTAQFNSNDYTVRIWPTPNADGFGFLQVYTRETAENLYNNILMKRLCIARVRKAWGFNVGKYNVSQPGGGTINYQLMIDSGEKDEAAALEAMVTESVPPCFFVG